MPSEDIDRRSDVYSLGVLLTGALSGWKLKWGEDHPTTLETTNDFGVLRREQEHYEEAEPLLQQALDQRLNSDATPPRSPSYFGLEYPYFRASAPTTRLQPSTLLSANSEKMLNP